MLRTSGSTASQHPGYPLPRKKGWMGSLPPPTTPRVHPKAHRDASSQATTFCLLGTPWPCWSSCWGQQPSSARRRWARGEQHSPAVRWQGHGSCSQALCPRGGTLQRQVVSGDGFQRDGVWQPAACYCSLGHDLQETECTGCRMLRGSLMASMDTQTPSPWRVSRALRGETEAHSGRGSAPVLPLTPETTLKHPPVSTRAMRGLCPPVPAGPISPPWSTFCAGPWRCPWQERCSGRRDT